MLLLIRAMSPEVLAVDEIGHREDVLAIEEVINAGVKIICTVHGRDYYSILQRPSLQPLLAGKAFERYLVLSAKRVLVQWKWFLMPMVRRFCRGW